MNKRTCIEVRNVDEVAIFRIYVTEEGTTTEPQRTSEADPAPRTKAPRGNGDAPRGNADDAMTEAQRRFLFRILSGKGFTGEKAQKHLAQLFQVAALKDVSKRDASDMIERLLAEGGEGGNGRGSSLE